MELPNTFDDVTLEWINAALGVPAEGVRQVVGVEVEPMPEGKGLIGDLAVLHLDWAATNDDHDWPTRLVLKLPAASPASRNIGEMLGAYAREVAFYNEVAPRVSGANLARCFFARADPVARRWVVLLEHLEPDPFDFTGGATRSHADSAVDALADFHAPWWEHPTPFEWMPGFDATGVGGLQPLWLQNLPVFLDRYADVLPGPTSTWVLNFAPNLTDWSTRAASEPLTMVHSDYRIDNLVFVDGEVTIIDWQTAMRAPAAMDLSCFIATSLAIEHRRDHEDDLIDRYLDRLEFRGIEIDRSWFRHSYDENLLWWMGQFGNNLAHLRPEDPAVQTALTTMVERVYTAALDRDIGAKL